MTIDPDALKAVIERVESRHMTALDKAIEAANDHASSADDLWRIWIVTAQVRNELQVVLMSMEPDAITRMYARTSIANILRLMDALDGREP